jgi:hypothetical protein
VNVSILNRNVRIMRRLNTMYEIAMRIASVFLWWVQSDIALKREFDRNCR